MAPRRGSREQPCCVVGASPVACQPLHSTVLPDAFAMPRPVYHFGPFRLDPAARELRRGDERLALPSSAFDGLAYLVAHRERAVGRDELISAIWGRLGVTDTQLGQAIVRIRSVLGDTGREQQYVRTVPRFGYRFVAATAMADDTSDMPVAAAHAATAEASPDAVSAGSVEVVPHAPDDLPLSPSPDSATAPASGQDAEHAHPAGNGSETASSRSPAMMSAPPRSRARRVALGALLGVAIVAIATVATLRLSRAPVEAPATASPDVAAKADPQPPSAAIVWPASVEAGEDWAWLRLGVMDLVSNRLRAGRVPTVPSDSVVGLVKAREEASPGAVDPLAADTLRIEPRVTRDGARWRVDLQARGGGHDLLAVGQSEDVLAAARAAADSLLIKLGQAPPAGGEGHGRPLEELLQRAHAASLAGQVSLAADLVGDAPPELRDHPEVVYVMANVDLRAGHYAQAETRLRGLLDDAAFDPGLRGRALNTLAALHVRRDEIAPARAEYEEAARLLAGRDGSDLGLSLLGLGITAAVAGELDVAFDELGRARTAMEGAGNLLGIAQVEANLAAVDALRQRPAEAARRLRDVEARFARLAAGEELAYTRLALADAYLQLLQVDEAMAAVDRTWPPERHVPNLRLRWEAVMRRAEVFVAQGRLAEADALLARLREGADATADAVTMAMGVSLEARIAALRGQDAEAARLAGEALVPALERPGGDSRPWVLTTATHLRALRRSGAIDAAATATHRFEAWLAQRPDDWRAAWGAFARAEQAWIEGRRDVALADYETALTRLRGVAVPEDTVAITQPYLLALIDAGDLERAGTLAGHLSSWAESDFRVAWAQGRLYQALGKAAAAREATDRALRLAGERALPGQRREGPAAAGAGG